MAQAARRLGRGRRDDRRRDHRQGRRRDPVARRSGRLARIVAEPGETVAVGEPIAEIDAGARAGEAHPRGVDDEPRPARRAAPSGETDRSGFYSPVVRRIADKHGVDLEQVEGTGIGGRVRKKDVLAYVEARRQRQAGRRAPSAHRVALPARRARGRSRAAERADRDERRAPRADVADAPGDRPAHGRQPAHRRALHDDRRGRHVAGRRPARAAEAGDGAARRPAHLPRVRRRGDGRGARAVTRCSTRRSRARRSSTTTTSTSGSRSPSTTG